MPKGWLRQFNTISPENLLKSQSLHPEPDRFTFDAADRYVAFGLDRGMAVIGHNLVWHSQTPRWRVRDSAPDFFSVAIDVRIPTGAGGSGVLLSDAVVDNGLSLMAMPPDLDAALRKFIPPFGASGNPVDITGGEPPKTYQNTVRLGYKWARGAGLL